MKAYKATYKHKCRDQEYKVGKTYSSDKMKICRYGIHYCNELKDTLTYYPYTKDLVMLEIEVLGSIESVTDKSVTDKMKVLRVVPKDEWNVTGLEFDDRGNRISLTCPSGNKYLNEYNERNNMISKTYPNGDKYLYEYNERNNMISSTYPNGDKHLYEYDKRDNMISSTHPSGDKYLFEYNERNNMISMTHPSGDKYLYEYDEMNNMISQTHPDGLTHLYDVATITES